MLPNGLKLFIADIINEETNGEEFWCIVGRTYDSSLKRFIKRANKVWDVYSYYFYEAENEEVESFIEYHNPQNIKAGIYEL